jgi:hypothetical protein
MSSAAYSAAARRISGLHAVGVRQFGPFRASELCFLKTLLVRKVAMSAKNIILCAAVTCVVLGLVGQARADFSPSSVSSLQSWLDPSDSSKLTIDGSNRVLNFVDSKAVSTNWTNKNPNGTGADVLAGLPIYNATGLNGHPALAYTWTGTNTGKNLRAPASILNLAPANTVLEFFGVVTATGSKGAFWSTDPHDQSNPLTILEAGNNGVGSLSFYTNGDGWKNSAAGIFPMNGTPTILEMVYDGTGGAGTGTAKMYVNGTLSATLTGYANNFSVTGAQIATGTQAWSTGTGVYGMGIYNGLNGLEGDMLWFNGVLSRGTDGFSGDAGNVGYYLAQKYGISGSAYIGTPVPEPSTLALLAAGLAALLCYAWRKRK